MLDICVEYVRNTSNIKPTTHVRERETVFDKCFTCVRSSNNNSQHRDPPTLLHHGVGPSAFVDDVAEWAQKLSGQVAPVHSTRRGCRRVQAIGCA